MLACPNRDDSIMATMQSVTKEFSKTFFALSFKYLFQIKIVCFQWSSKIHELISCGREETIDRTVSLNLNARRTHLKCLIFTCVKRAVPVSG